MIIKIVIILFYIFIIGAVLNVKYDIDNIKPINVWISVFWPILFIVICFKIIALLINTIIGYGLFMFNIKYIKSNLFKNINDMIRKDSNGA